MILCQWLLETDLRSGYCHSTDFLVWIPAAWLTGECIDWECEWALLDIYDHPFAHAFLMLWERPETDWDCSVKITFLCVQARMIQYIWVIYLYGQRKGQGLCLVSLCVHVSFGNPIYYKYVICYSTALQIILYTKLTGNLFFHPRKWDIFKWEGGCCGVQSTRFWQ